jgi:PilZ domain-containing protein
MAERRRAQRQKSFLRGCVYFNKRRGALDCLIRDLSEQGARIIFSENVSVPDQVDLYIPQKEQTVRARVQWRHGDEIGLAFPDAVRAADGTSDGELALRVAQLESEIAGLRRLVKKIKAEIETGEDVDAA